MVRCLFATGDKRRVSRRRASTPEDPPGVPPEAFFFCGICANICAKTRQPSELKRLPNLEKACIMPWDVLEKKRADHTHTPEVRSSSYSML